MKFNIFSLMLMLCLVSCNTETDVWTAFTKCGSNNCVKETVAVKDAFLKDPAGMLSKFQKTYEKGEDHVVGWLHILRDSVLFNSSFGSTEARFALQQQIVKTAKPFESDKTVGEMAKSIVGEIENLAIMSELEEGSPELIPITGSYAYDLGDHKGNGTLEVSQLSYNKIKFKLTVVGAAPAHNQGMLEGEADLGSNIAKYSTKAFGGACDIQITFGEKVEIKTTQGESATCGFGNGVVADGTFERKSFKNPFLSKKDAQAADNLLGEWQSADDPKAVIKIANGEYVDIVDGKTGDTYIYNYYPVCISGCNAPAKVPCLVVSGQDDMCYTVVKADGKTLHLSLIGGKGNTLIYNKKK